MEESNAPNLIIAGGDPKRLQWLTHHVTSHWSNASVTALSDPDGASLARALAAADPDALLLQIDFSAQAQAADALGSLQALVRSHPALQCVVLAQSGGELAAVRSMKAGASDYLPLSLLNRDSLLAVVAEAIKKRRAADAESAAPVLAEAQRQVEVPGYSIIKEISTSNFSSVYLARAERLRRNVVLKVMQRGAGQREIEDAERFQREYEIISSIAHRAIAEIHDFGSLPDHLYLAMEYFPCGDLRDRLRNPLSTAESLYYLRSIAAALRVIHVFGIFHRDLKPANVMLREDNSPVLIDFGLARRAREDVTMTSAGQVLGSPYYISPEQAQGQRVDARTDLYSLGVMFYEMLTGNKPYTGCSAVQIMAQHADAPIPALPDGVAAQQPLLNRLMAKDPRDRYASVDELLAEIDPALCAVA